MQEKAESLTQEHKGRSYISCINTTLPWIELARPVSLQINGHPLKSYRNEMTRDGLAKIEDPADLLA
jgi:hypothetical protein